MTFNPYDSFWKLRQVNEPEFVLPEQGRDWFTVSSKGPARPGEGIMQDNVTYRALHEGAAVLAMRPDDYLIAESRMRFDLQRHDPNFSPGEFFHDDWNNARLHDKFQHDPHERRTILRLASRLVARKPIDPPRLGINVAEKGPLIADQEGRHRAFAAKMMRVPTIPVVAHPVEWTGRVGGTKFVRMRDLRGDEMLRYQGRVRTLRGRL